MSGMRSKVRSKHRFIANAVAVIAYLLVVSPSFGQVEKLDPDLPLLKPRVFASGFISLADQYEFGSVFSNDNSEFFYAANKKGKAEVLYCKFRNGKWTKPRTILSHPSAGMNDPFLSPDEQRLYYISDMQSGNFDESSDYDIWYSERTDEGWSEPINAGSNINTSRNEYYISFTQSGTMYFSSDKNAKKRGNNDFDIYSSAFKGGEFQEATRLDDSINSQAYEADVFIAPDESYVIYAAKRKDGYGQGDLYISFKNDQGEWNKSVNMGLPINSEEHELCPFVTLDGKYFFYTSKKDIYWVSAEILEKYR